MRLLPLDPHRWTRIGLGIVLVGLLVSLGVPGDNGCGGPIDEQASLEDGEDDVATGYVEGSPLALGILRVASEVPLAKLKSSAEVGLAGTAATAISKARAGADKKDGTADDVKFATLAKLDAVPYVGPAAFKKLAAYATSHGMVPAGAANPMSAQATRVPWSGYWWSMLNGELVLGWNDGAGRKTWTPAETSAFDTCISQYSTQCTTLLASMAGTNGVKLSPLMKFDLYVRKQLEAELGAGNAPNTAYSHAAKWELQNHYIGDNQNHRYWASRGYAGKCIGWALANLSNDEPIAAITLNGVTFKPADIKGLLATIYNAAQFFVPDELAVGQEFHDNPGSNSQANYDDTTPPDFVRALFETIGKGAVLEGDLEPGDGVWNYPIYKYELSYTKTNATTLAAKATIHYANDEVDIDGVFSTVPGRPDLKSRALTFDLTFAGGFTGDLSKATGGKWTGAAVDTHPDVLLKGIEQGWRTAIYDYSGTQMNTEVNFALLKRVKRGTAWVPVVDELLQRYYAGQQH